MENVFASLVACSSCDILTILRKKRQEISNLNVEATGQRREQQLPKIFTKIHLKYRIKGQKSNLEAVKKAI